LSEIITKIISLFFSNLLSLGELTRLVSGSVSLASQISIIWATFPFECVFVPLAIFDSEIFFVFQQFFNSD